MFCLVVAFYDGAEHRVLQQHGSVVNLWQVSGRQRRLQELDPTRRREACRGVKGRERRCENLNMKRNVMRSTAFTLEDDAPWICSDSCVQVREAQGNSKDVQGRRVRC
ncbi:hypothetical protein E2C01_026536 [Portunus trituberculatus]|uniref:Uncharacterized protein n=1 Tax=Portunus trituberculatus TaxID=210409 RepID=A0A5B7EJF7_PORTR|nr:hypothetical protein [Portunus trituberculatus]